MSERKPKATKLVKLTPSQESAVASLHAVGMTARAMVQSGLLTRRIAREAIREAATALSAAFTESAP